MTIHCRGLTKRFRGRSAVDGLDLEVGQGEVFGFLGPNGAGKTTTIRMLLGLLRPDSGEMLVLDRPVSDPEAAARIGAMVGEPAFYPWLSGRQNLRILLDTGPRAPADAIDEMIERTGLVAADRKVRTYSQGMRQRLGLAAALLRRPKLLVLDEPLNHLDPIGIRELRTLIRELALDGTTVFLSSHLLGEAEQVCQRVGVIHRGRLLATGGVDELGAVDLGLRVEVDPGQHDAAVRLLAPFGARVEGPGVLLILNGDGRAISRALADGGVFAKALTRVRPSLEDRFLTLTTTTEMDDAAAPR